LTTDGIIYRVFIWQIDVSSPILIFRALYAFFYVIHVVIVFQKSVIIDEKGGSGSAFQNKANLELHNILEMFDLVWRYGELEILNKVIIHGEGITQHFIVD
jgi:hypothetical protein